MNCTNVTIVIPHYNAPNKLEKLLVSIGYHKDVQVVIVDDRSNKELDRLNFIRQNYSNDNVTFLSNEMQNKGAGTCRNIGLSAANGRWLLFADADDVLLDGWYQTISSFFDSEYDIIYFTPTSIKDNGEPSCRHLQYANLIQSQTQEAENRLRYRFTPPWSKLIRHSIVTENHITFEEVRYSNDVMFSIRTSHHAHKITTDSRSIYCVIEDSNNLSLTKAKDDYAFYIRCCVECERWDYLRGKLTYDELKSVFRQEVLRRLGVVIKRRYGLKAIIKYWRLFREHRMPLLFLKWRHYENDT